MGGKSKDHNFNPGWLKTLKDNNKYRNQEGSVVTEQNILRQSRKVSNWKHQGEMEFRVSG